MRFSWILAGGLFLLTLLFASMELEFMATAAFLLLVLVALAGYHRPESLASAASPTTHSDDKPPEVYSQASAPDPNDLEGGAHHEKHETSRSQNEHHARHSPEHSQEHHAHDEGSARHSPHERHLHDAAHSDKKHSADAHSEKHSPDQKHSDEQNASDQKHSDNKHLHDAAHSDKKHSADGRSHGKHFSPEQ